MKTLNADKYFSLYIRVRDADENGLARCITCGVMKPVKQMDCGHWQKRQHQNTRFNEMNCQSQCKKCNAFEQGRDADFERALIEKYGQDKVNMILWSARQTVKRTKFDLEYLAVYYKQKAVELARAKGIELW